MRLALVCALSLAGTHPLRAIDTVVNLTDFTIDTYTQSTVTMPYGSTFVGGYIGGVFFRRPVNSSEAKGGSGIFRDLYNLGDTSVSASPYDSQEGYNRNKAIDSDVPSGFDPYIKVSDLPVSVGGSTSYYVFALDINEVASDGENYLSLDDVRIYVQNTAPFPQDPGTLPNSVSAIEALGTWTNVYRMSPNNTDTTENANQNYVFIDYNLGFGSGKTADMFMFVPTSYFSAYDPSAYVYLYSAFGLYTLRGTGRTAGFDPSDGDEQWATYTNLQFDPYWVAPEPSTVWGGIGCGLLAIAGLARLLRRRRGALQTPAIG